MITSITYQAAIRTKENKFVADIIAHIKSHNTGATDIHFARRVKSFGAQVTPCAFRGYVRHDNNKQKIAQIYINMHYIDLTRDIEVYKKQFTDFLVQLEPFFNKNGFATPKVEPTFTHAIESVEEMELPPAPVVPHIRHLADRMFDSNIEMHTGDIDFSVKRAYELSAPAPEAHFHNNTKLLSNAKRSAIAGFKKLSRFRNEKNPFGIPTDAQILRGNDIVAHYADIIEKLKTLSVSVKIEAEPTFTHAIESVEEMELPVKVIAQESVKVMQSHYTIIATIISGNSISTRKSLVELIASAIQKDNRQAYGALNRYEKKFGALNFA